MADATDMILPMLREMLQQNSARHGEVTARFDRIQPRLASIEAAQVSFRQALTAGSLLSKLVISEFEGRIEALERKFAALEAMK